MARTRVAKSGKRERSDCVRASVSFGGEDYAELERIAGEKRVSVAWVVRDAVSRYLSERNPLFRATDAARGRA